MSALTVPVLPVMLQYKLAFAFVLMFAGGYVLGRLHGIYKANRSWNEVFSKHAKSVSAYEMEQSRTVESGTSCDPHGSRIQSKECRNRPAGRGDADTLH